MTTRVIDAWWTVSKALVGHGRLGHATLGATDLTSSDSKRAPRSLCDQLAQVPKPRPAAPPREQPLAEASEATFTDLVGPVNPIVKAPLIAPTAPVGSHEVRVFAKRTPSPLTVLRDEEHVRGFGDGVSARVLDELSSGRPLPSRELDLHGLRAAQARVALTRAVDEAHREGIACLLVICGRGKHSDGEAVLPEVAVERLVELDEHVLAFCTAPARLGGSGALLVRLRSR